MITWRRLILLPVLLLLLLAPVSAVAQDDCPAGHIRNPPVSRLDHDYLVAAFKASFRGLKGYEPSMRPGDGVEDGEYYIGASNHYGVYGDDQCHAGWSGYWEAWISTGRGDLALVQTPARFLPGAAPPPSGPPSVPNPPPLSPPPPPPLDLSGIQAQLAAIAVTLDRDYAVDVEAARAAGDAHAALAQNITDGRAENRSAWDEVKPIVVFVSKYIVPAASAVLVCVQTKRCS